MSLLKELFLVTQTLYKHVTAALPDNIDARDQYIEDLETYLSQREKLLKKMEGKIEFNEIEQKLGREMVKMNEQIHLRLDAMKGKVRLDLKHMKKKKQSQEVYESPYEETAVDGVFFDKKN